jgi:GH25 family lysozyme M1 (1,4-beta-N-acetylmuramidase)
MATTFDRIKKTASDEVGYREKQVKGSFNNDTKFADEVPGLEWADFQPWCATFVSWVALRAGVPELYPRTASCDQAGLWWKARKRWSEYPARGAQVFYGSPRDLNHTGIVIDFTDTTITTVEGNTNNTGAREGNGVYLKKRQRRDDNVVGYGYPMFPEGIESADPDFASAADQAKAANAAGPAAGQRIDGVDISHWQDGPMDFAAARAAGLKFVVHKSTDGVDFMDDKYDERRPDVAAAGMIWGGYHFARPGKSGAAKQAQFFLSHLRPEPGDLRPVLDLEKTGGLSPARLAQWAHDFVEEVKKRLGTEPIVYTPFPLGPTRCQLWVARYSDANNAPRIPRPWTKYAIWQFSNGVFGVPNHVPGLGHCDLNTLGVGAKLDQLRIPGEGVAVPQQRPAASQMARALATNREHAAALKQLTLTAETRPVAEQVLAALETERKLLERLGEAMPAGVPAGAGKG